MTPFQLCYSLSRGQRLRCLIGQWSWWPLLIVPLVWLFFAALAGDAVWTGSLGRAAGFGGLALAVNVLFAGLFGGLADVLFVARRDVDIVVEGNAAGILSGRERWYLFLDGITDIRQEHDLWTIQHHNGTVLHIPTTAITAEQMEYLREAMRRGHTPEGIRAVIERGRRIEALLASDQSKAPP